jgi:glycosyltransferase involved in cell wall biosynthesis
VRRLRVVHCPTVVGGNAPALARAERELGLDSVCVSLDPNPWGYEVDEQLPADAGRARRELARFRLLRRALRDADVVHFNFGRTILPSPPLASGASIPYRLYAGLLGLRDLPLLAWRGKGIVVTFQGDDVRQGDVLRARYERSLATVVPAAYEPVGDRTKRRVVAAFDRWAASLLYLNPDLAHALPTRARFVPYASVDPRFHRPVPRSPSAVPVVAHAPSDRRVKGTEAVLAAVDELRARRVPLELRLVEGVSNTAARAAIQSADVFVDQLHAGWYGAAAVEAMAAGVPVLAHVRGDDLGVLPPSMRAELPVLDATPESLARRLEALLTDAPARQALGERARAFAERWHDPRSIAQMTAELYELAVTRARSSRGSRMRA